MDDLTVRRLNLWIKQLTAEDHEMYGDQEELASAFLRLSNKDIEKLDQLMVQPLRIVVRSPYRGYRPRSPSLFWTPPRSSMSSGGGSMGYRSKP